MPEKLGKADSEDLRSPPQKSLKKTSEYIIDYSTSQLPAADFKQGGTIRGITDLGLYVGVINWEVRRRHYLGKHCFDELLGEWTALEAYTAYIGIKKESPSDDPSGHM